MMKQALLEGFGAPYLSGAEAPKDMPYEVVSMCRSEADAIAWSIGYAVKRFGYRQIDIARLCGWRTDNHLSHYKKAPDGTMPSKRRSRFAQVTGCNLLEQYERIQAPPATINQRSDIALAMMMRAAA